MTKRTAFSHNLRKGLALAAGCLLMAGQASAQSILRDAETEALLRDMAAPLVKAAGLDPKNVDIVLINDPSINAFVAGGQAVYVHSGLINEASHANEVQGVIAHELGHITGGHVIRFDEGMKPATGMFTPVSVAIISAPRMKGGKESPRVKAAQSARLGAKVLVSCW